MSFTGVQVVALSKAYFRVKSQLALQLQPSPTGNVILWDGEMTSLKSRLVAAACSLTALAFFSTAASASLIVNYGSSSVGSNVINGKKCAAGGAAAGSVITGCLADNHSQAVSFKTTDKDQIEFLKKNGNAEVVGRYFDYDFSNLTIALVGHTFNTVSFDVLIEGTLGLFSDITFTSNGETKTTSIHYGDNYFTIKGEDLTSLSMTTYFDLLYPIETDYIWKVKDVKIGGIDAGNHNPPPAVPEPGTLSLLGVALAGLAVARRRRKAKA